MSDNIAMGKPGTQFSGDGISLSWPEQRNGEPGLREVIEVPPGKRSGRVRRMIVDGAIVETDLPVTPVVPTGLAVREIFEGGSREALRRMREPAGPVIRKVFVAVGELEDRVAETTVIEDDPDAGRRPAAESTEEPEPEVPEPSFEEKVEEMADAYAVGTLQRKARALGLSASDMPETWGDKRSLATEILTRRAAEESEPSE